LQKLNALNKELSPKVAVLQALQSQIAQEQTKLDSTRKFKHELGLETHEVRLTEEQFRGNSLSYIIGAAEEMRANIA